MEGAILLGRVRRAAGLSQQELSRRARTSRPTLSAYENGRKSPSLDVVARLLAEAGFDLDAVPRVSYASVPGPRGSAYVVPDRLCRLPVDQALATVTLPLVLNWSDPGRQFHLARRHDRAQVYEIVLRDGTADHLQTYVDGALLVDIWPELVLPRTLRAAWAPVIAATLPSGETEQRTDRGIEDVNADRISN
ncbi:helix-turn-helix domain-containing protein [Antrihabitans spumae]|jgi:transcriptional regulator with XRE-family HTH domain|uniref:Helix-turn-helix domain-containing protein n=1 Tax=Antrihabitans spumae TaxID=3373370 RepID=A0ABW7KX67_9NOCA